MAARLADVPLTEDERADLDRLLAQWARWLRAVAAKHHQRARMEYEDFHAALLADLVRTHRKYSPARGSYSTFVAWRARHLASRCAARRARTLRTVNVSGVHRQRALPNEDGDILATARDRKAPDPGDEAAEREVGDTVTAAVARLPARQRAAVTTWMSSEVTRNEVGRTTLEAGFSALRETLAGARG